MEKKEPLSRDKNHVPIQSEIGIQTSTADTVVKNSPLSYSSVVLTLTPPDDAVSLVLAPSTDLRISESAGMTTYYKITANSAEIIACANGNPLYIVRDSSDGTLNFRYNLA